MIMPQKKPPGKDLTEEDKTANKAVSQIRVRVENPLSYLKHFNILGQKYRGRVTNQDNLDLSMILIYLFLRLI